MHSVVHDPIVAARPPVERSPGEPFVVGMVGRIARWKGQHVFLRAFAHAFPGGSERARIVGEAMFGADDQAYAVELHETARTLGIADRVEFRGFREDIWRELAEMDVFVRASTTPEPFGQVVVEAMLAGLPVIASAEGGPAEILTDEVDGILRRAGDVEALAGALRRLWEDPGLRARLGANGRDRAELAPQDQGSVVSSLYGRLISPPRRPGSDNG